MNKIWLIIQREYLTRVKKKSFLILTFLGPILIASVISLIIWIGIEETEHHRVLVVDDKYPTFQQLKGGALIEFDYGNYDLNYAKEVFYDSDYTAVLYIPENIEYANTALLYFKKQPSLVTIKDIENKVEKIVENLKLELFNIKKEDFEKVNTNFHLNAVKFSSSGNEEKIDPEKYGVGFAFGLLIYLFIFLYGVQVMRGVIEEKTNRIVEVIISSVKPFQLMIGKIVGVAMVGLTQFLLWVVFTSLLYSLAVYFIIGVEYGAEAINSGQMSTELLKDVQGSQGLNPKDFIESGNIISRINFPLMLSMFGFYFLFGYLLYSALFAAVGSAVDSETDVQQFMLPITLPLVAAYIISITTIQNPDGAAAFWFSIIPFTSPIVMMVRLAVGVGDGGIPIWEVGLSMGLLILGFLFTVWIASKIYRIGLLTYGKRPTYRDLVKWILRAER